MAKLKKIIKIIVPMLALILVCIFNIACSSSKKSDNLENVSEYRKNLFVGQAGNYLATFTSGQREKDYIMDGNKTNLVDFGVLTLKFNYNFGNTLPKFELKVNNNLYSGELEKNPYDNTYVFDIETQVNDGDLLNLYLVDLDENINLVCWSKNWNINYLSALKIFTEKHNEDIKNNSNKNKLNGEIYIKIVSSDKQLSSVYWYVLLTCTNGDVYASLIDVNSGEIVQN